MKKRIGLLLATLLVASTAAFTACNLTGGNSSSEESTTSSVTTSSPADSSSVAPATYTVTFNSDGGSDVAAAPVTTGEKATLCLAFSARQREILLAGGTLNYTKQSK